MNTIRKFAFAVLLVAASVLLGGCAGVLQYLNIASDPDRPYPPQVEVAADVRGQLMSKKIQEVEIYVSSRVFHYDTSNVIKIEAEVLKKEGRKLSLRDLPSVLNPPAKEAAHSSRVVNAFKQYLDGAGFKRVEVPCKECLIVLIDYGERRYEKEGKTVFAVRTRIYFLGVEIVAARDDWAGWWKDPQAEPSDKLMASASQQMAKEMTQAWEWRVASWRQRLSAVQ